MKILNSDEEQLKEIDRQIQFLNKERQNIVNDMYEKEIHTIMDKYVGQWVKLPGWDIGHEEICDELPKSCYRIFRIKKLNDYIGGTSVYFTIEDLIAVKNNGIDIGNYNEKNYNVTDYRKLKVLSKAQFEKEYNKIYDFISKKLKNIAKKNK